MNAINLESSFNINKLCKVSRTNKTILGPIVHRQNLTSTFAVVIAKIINTKISYFGWKKQNFESYDMLTNFKGTKTLETFNGKQ